jgi:hypothetical protein
MGIQVEGTVQSANARFLAFCRLCGTSTMGNPIVEDEI